VTPPAARAAAEETRGEAAERSGDAEYKVVEVSPVGEETLERALNDWTRRGFAFESLHFVSREGSHRPALAYLFFVRSGPSARGGT
jgi:hypothetical protein